MQPYEADSKFREMPLRVDTFREKICVIRCTHAQDGKAWRQMSKKTHTNPLSKQEIEMLRKNPYVASATSNTVRFTEAFKKLVYDAKVAGIPVVETMRKYGIDPDVLGPSRVDGFSYTLTLTVLDEPSLIYFDDQQLCQRTDPGSDTERKGKFPQPDSSTDRKKPGRRKEGKRRS